MNEYGKKVAKKMDEYMNNLDSVDREIRDIENALEGYQVRGALAAGVKKAFDKSEIAEVKSDEAYEITQNLLDGSFDTSAINTNFEERLNDAIENLQPEWTGFKNDVMADLTKTELDLNDRGVNLRSLGLVMDGTVDNYQDVMDALATYKNVVVPGDAIIGTTETIVVSQGQSLVGLTENSRGYGNTAIIKYIGEFDPRKTVVQIGKNKVGSEPTLDGTDIQFRNFIVDGNNLVGFGVYGTYLTNETLIDNIVASNTLEYGQYYATAWYASFTNLRALKNKGKGLAFGMPLEYQDGTKVVWQSTGEMNNCVIENLRAHSNGQYYSVDNPNTFNPENPEMRMKGYGIGLGVGSSFNVNHITSEQNGGVNLYSYTSFQAIKSISNVYLEGCCVNSGLNVTTHAASIILENTIDTGDAVVFENVYVNNGNGGGIYHVGRTGRKTWLKNVYQPRFLKSLDGLTSLEVYSVVLKDRVHFDCGQYNSLESIAKGIDVIKTVDTRYSFTVDTKPSIGFKLVYVKGDGTTPWGSFNLNYDNGQTVTRNFPAGLSTDYILTVGANGNLTSITKAGGTGGISSNVTFKVVDTPSTYI